MDATELLHIDEHNAHLFIPDADGVVAHDGKRYSTGAKPRTMVCGSYPWAPTFDAAGIQVIPTAQWEPLIAAGQGNFLPDIVGDTIPCGDQNGMNYCHAWGTTMGAMIARLTEGLPYVALAPTSIGGPITGWRNAGADPADDLQQFEQYGACPLADLPDQYSISPNSWKSTWKADALNNRVLAAVDVNTWQETMTMLLLRIPVVVGLNWWGHCICYVAPVTGNQIMFRNSWGASWGTNGYATLNQRKGTPDGAFAILSMLPSETVQSHLRRRAHLLNLHHHVLAS